MTAAQRETPKKRPVLRGQPGALTALVPVKGETRRIKDARITGAAFRRARVDPAAEGLAQWTVELDHWTPPGTYEAVFEADGESHEVTLIVETRRELEISPAHLHEDVTPGGRTHVTLTILNRSNVSITIPKSHAFGLFQARGLEGAAAAAYAAEKKKGLERLEVGIEEMARRHALVRAQLKPGPITIEPRDHAQVEAVIAWPKEMAADCRYHGTWPIGPANLSVRVHVVSQPEAIQ